MALGVLLLCTVGFLGAETFNAMRAAAGQPFRSLATSLDRLVSLDPRWVWVYVSYYPGCLLPAFVARSMRLFRQAAVGFALQFVAAVPFFLWLPARITHAPIHGDGWSERLLGALYRIDLGYNIFPSLHVANVVLVAAVCSRARRRLTWPVWLWAVAVCFSTLAIKQHFAVDLLAGAVLGAVVVWLVLGRRDGGRFSAVVLPLSAHRSGAPQDGVRSCTATPVSRQEVHNNREVNSHGATGFASGFVTPEGNRILGSNVEIDVSGIGFQNRDVSD